MNSRMPKQMWLNAVKNPPQTIQMILQKRERHPMLDVLLTTCLPKGHNTKPASLKHCSPHGMPTIEIHKAMPPNTYPTAATKPPNTSQIRFPKKFMRYNFIRLKYGIAYLATRFFAEWQRCLGVACVKSHKRLSAVRLNVFSEGGNATATANYFLTCCRIQ